MLTSEEKRSDNSFHLAKGHKRNESLDCRVYNMCAGDVFLDDEVYKKREKYIKKGVSRIQVKKITRRHIILRMKAKILPNKATDPAITGQKKEG